MNPKLRKYSEFAGMRGGRWGGGAFSNGGRRANDVICAGEGTANAGREGTCER